MYYRSMYHGTKYEKAMARAGIYKSEVVRARNNLLAMGRHPSIDSIRIELGNTGSKGTIHRFLKEIEEEEGGVAGTQVAVSEAIQDLSSRLAERLYEEADQRISALTDKQKAEVAELNNVMTALRSEVDGFRGQVERLTLALAAEKAANEDTQTKLQEEKLTVARISQRIHDLDEQRGKEEAHRQSLEEKHRHAREALEHFRQLSKDQREQDQRQHEQQIQFLQGELRTAKEVLNAKQQETLLAHQDNARVANELAHTKSELHQLKTEVRALRHSKEQLIALEQKCEQLNQQVSDTEERIAAVKIERDDLAVISEERLALAQSRELELATLKAVQATQDQVLENIRKYFSIQGKADDTKKEVPPVKTQESLFDSGD